jgi:hypothetical protein
MPVKIMLSINAVEDFEYGSGFSGVKVERTYDLYYIVMGLLRLIFWRYSRWDKQWNELFISMLHLSLLQPLCKSKNR